MLDGVASCSSPYFEVVVNNSAMGNNMISVIFTFLSKCPTVKGVLTDQLDDIYGNPFRYPDIRETWVGVDWATGFNV